MSLIGYDHAELHCARPKNARRDSGGVAVYYESHMANYITLIKSTEDCILWIKLAKEYTNSDKDLFICICDSVPVGSSREEINKSKCFRSIIGRCGRAVK